MVMEFVYRVGHAVSARPWLILALLTNTFALSTFARPQFPLSASVDGDTVYSELGHSTATSSWMLEDGNLLLFRYRDDTAYATLITDLGAVSSTNSIQSGQHHGGNFYRAQNRFYCPGFISTQAGNRASVGTLATELDSLSAVWPSSSTETSYFHSLVSINGSIVAVGHDNQTDMEPFILPIAAAFDTSGIEQWSWTTSISDHIWYAFDVIGQSDGAFALTGMSGNWINSAMIDAYCTKLSSNGTMIATHTIGNTGFTQGNVILELSDQSLMLFAESSASPSSLLVAGATSMCEEEWTRYYPGLYVSDAWLDTLHDQVITTGRTAGGLLVAAFSDLGDTLWTRTYGVPGSAGMHVQSDGSGGVLITGRHGPNNAPYPYLVWLNGEGLASEISIASHMRQSPVVIAPNPTAGTSLLYGLELEQGPIEVSVLANDGSILQSYRSNSSSPFHLDGTALETGLYHLTISLPSGSLSRAKWMVQH